MVKNPEVDIPNSGLRLKINTTASFDCNVRFSINHRINSFPLTLINGFGLAYPFRKKREPVPASGMMTFNISALVRRISKMTESVKATCAIEGERSPCTLTFQYRNEERFGCLKLVLMAQECALFVLRQTVVH